MGEICIVGCYTPIFLFLYGINGMAHQNQFSRFDLKNLFLAKTGWMVHQNAINLSKKFTFAVSTKLQIW